MKFFWQQANRIKLSAPVQVGFVQTATLYFKERFPFKNVFPVRKYVYLSLEKISNVTIKEEVTKKPVDETKYRKDFDCF